MLGSHPGPNADSGSHHEIHRLTRHTVAAMSRLAALPVIVGLALAACSGGSSGGSATSSSPAATLSKAKQNLDASSTVHFTLTSSNVPSGGVRLIGGTGSVARPASFTGKLNVVLNGSQVSIDIVSAGGTVYAKLPFSTGFQKADPETFGLSDPASLISPTTGISSMFTQLTGVTAKGKQRIGSDVVTEIDGQLPGSLVKSLLTDADPAQPVKARLFVTTPGNQLRQVDLTGPFFTSSAQSTFDLVLDQYGATVKITPPATS